MVEQRFCNYTSSLFSLVFFVNCSPYHPIHINNLPVGCKPRKRVARYLAAQYDLPNHAPLFVGNIAELKPNQEGISARAGARRTRFI